MKEPQRDMEDLRGMGLLCYETKRSHFALIYIYAIPPKPLSEGRQKKLVCYIIASMICVDPDRSGTIC